MNIEFLKTKVLGLFSKPEDKDDLILEVFQYQISNNSLFHEFVKTSGGNLKPQTMEEISYLPIEFWKTQKIRSTNEGYSKVFESSGTTSQSSSSHFITDIDWYKTISKKIFESHYEKLKNHTILALLPSYLERDNSSLVYMVNEFCRESKSLNAFYLDNLNELNGRIKKEAEKGASVILFGVSFALLDFADQFCSTYEKLTIIETGGMKGRRKEMIKEELHAKIQRSFPQASIHSEYGMTELLSQAYANDGIHFPEPVTMNFTIYELNDPKARSKKGKSGRINIIDLANLETCCFIATNDIGRKNSEGFLKIMGRVDNARLRGCNLMYEV